MNHGRPDYEAIRDTTIARQLALFALKSPGNADPTCTVNRLAREILGLRVDDPVPESVNLFTNSTTYLMPFEEPVFVLRGQDKLAGDTVRHWAMLAEQIGVKPHMVESALRQAAAMDAWYRKKVPDLPTTFIQP